MQSQSANIALTKITSTLLSNREYIISINNPINSFISTGKKQYSLKMFINLNKNTIHVNFIKHKYKKRIYDYTYYTHRGIPLHLYQNNLTYNSTGKKYTAIIFTTTKHKKENKTIYHFTNK